MRVADTVCEALCNAVLSWTQDGPTAMQVINLCPHWTGFGEFWTNSDCT